MKARNVGLGNTSIVHGADDVGDCDQAGGSTAQRFQEPGHHKVASQGALRATQLGATPTFPRRSGGRLTAVAAGLLAVAIGVGTALLPTDAHAGKYGGGGFSSSGGGFKGGGGATKFGGSPGGGMKLGGPAPVAPSGGFKTGGDVKTGGTLTGGAAKTGGITAPSAGAVKLGGDSKVGGASGYAGPPATIAVKSGSGLAGGPSVAATNKVYGTSNTITPSSGGAPIVYNTPYGWKDANTGRFVAGPGRLSPSATTTSYTTASGQPVTIYRTTVIHNEYPGGGRYYSTWGGGGSMIDFGIGFTADGHIAWGPRVGPIVLAPLIGGGQSNTPAPNYGAAQPDVQRVADSVQALTDKLEVLSKTNPGSPLAKPDLSALQERLKEIRAAADAGDYAKASRLAKSLNNQITDYMAEIDAASDPDKRIATAFGNLATMERFGAGPALIEQVKALISGAQDKSKADDLSFTEDLTKAELIIGDVLQYGASLAHVEKEIAGAESKFPKPADPAKFKAHLGAAKDALAKAKASLKGYQPGGTLDTKAIEQAEKEYTAAADAATPGFPWGTAAGVVGAGALLVGGGLLYRRRSQNQRDTEKADGEIKDYKSRLGNAAEVLEQRDEELSGLKTRLVVHFRAHPALKAQFEELQGLQKDARSIFSAMSAVVKEAEKIAKSDPRRADAMVSDLPLNLEVNGVGMNRGQWTFNLLAAEYENKSDEAAALFERLNAFNPQ
jgi:hypothetical protein